MKAIVNIVRFLVGILFIISGFVKLNDPIGFGFKLEEYWEVFGMQWLGPFSTTMAYLICVAEIWLGLALLFRSHVKLTLWLLTAMIVFFTFLTFYSAWFNKVTDCGCFGDALKLTPWQSFWKDVILTVLISILWLGKNHIKQNPKMFPTILGVAIAFIYGGWCLYDLPVIDFTAYKIGNNIKQLMTIPANAKRDVYKTVLLYTKDGQDKEFSMDSIPDGSTGWKWKDTKNILVEKGYVPPIHDFTIQTIQGDDYTEDFLTADIAVLVVARKLDHTDAKPFDAFAQLAVALESKKSARIGALTASIPAEVEAFSAKRADKIPFYNTDHTTLKTMIRSNPGLIILKKGSIVGKWSENNIPSIDKLTELLK
jgi:uncharacterized membrane protein YphA (DoxX/SURF4 family)